LNICETTRRQSTQAERHKRSATVTPHTSARHRHRQLSSFIPHAPPAIRHRPAYQGLRTAPSDPSQSLDCTAHKGKRVVEYHNTTRHDTTRHDTTRHDTTRHDTTRHDTTRHDTTRHDTTRHDIVSSQATPRPRHDTYSSTTVMCRKLNAFRVSTLSRTLSLAQSTKLR
jgi:hypothetical protein